MGVKDYFVKVIVKDETMTLPDSHETAAHIPEPFKIWKSPAVQRSREVDDEK
jgi:hypothetical protein